MRHVLQTSVAGVVVAAVMGDVLSLSSYAAALPAFLLDARYSRAFEREADAFGLSLLDRAGIDRGHFVRFLAAWNRSIRAACPASSPRTRAPTNAAAPPSGNRRGGVGRVSRC